MIFNKSIISIFIILLSFFNAFAFDSQGVKAPDKSFDREKMVKPLIDKPANKKENHRMNKKESLTKPLENNAEKNRLIKKRSKKEIGNGIPLKGNTALLIAIVPNLIFLLAIITSFPVLLVLALLTSLIALVYSIKLIKFYKNNRDYPNSKRELLKGRLAILFSILWILLFIIMFIILLIFWGW